MRDGFGCVAQQAGYGGYELFAAVHYFYIFQFKGILVGDFYGYCNSARAVQIEFYQPKHLN